jgi:hypothetical protein
VGVTETVDFESREPTTEEETKAYNEKVMEYNLEQDKKTNEPNVIIYPDEDDDEPQERSL